MPQWLRYIAWIGSIALAVSVVAPPVSSPRADAGSSEAQSTSDDRLTRTVRQLAERSGAPQGSPGPEARAQRDEPEHPEAPQRTERPEPSDRAERREQAAPERPVSSDPEADVPAPEQRPLTGDHAGGETDSNELRRLGASFEDGESPEAGFSGAGDAGWVLQTITALGIVLGLLLLLRWGWMRLSGTQTAAATPVVEVLSRTPVAPRSHVLLLRIGPRILIVGDSGGGLRTLGSVDDEQEVADLLGAINAGRPDSISRNFQQLLSRFGSAQDEQAQSGAFDPAHAGPWDVEDDGRDHAEHLFDRTRHNLSGLASRIRTLSRKGGSP